MVPFLYPNLEVEAPPGMVWVYSIQYTATYLPTVIQNTASSPRTLRGIKLGQKSTIFIAFLDLSSHCSIFRCLNFVDRRQIEVATCQKLPVHLHTQQFLILELWSTVWGFSCIHFSSPCYLTLSRPSAKLYHLKLSVQEVPTISNTFRHNCFIF